MRPNGEQAITRQSTRKTLTDARKNPSKVRVIQLRSSVKKTAACRRNSSVAATTAIASSADAGNTG
jgi:hypothetical protein